MTSTDLPFRTLGSRLAEAPDSMELRQLLRVLRALHPREQDEAPELSARLSQPVRLRGSRRPDLPFAEVEAYRPRDGTQPPQVVTPVNALGGALGVLPNPDREAIALAGEPGEEEEDGIIPVLDLLWERLAELDHAAWLRPMFGLREECGDPGGLALVLRTLIAEPDGAPDALPGVDWRAFADRMNPSIRNHLGLQEVLAELLDVPVEVVPLWGAWFPVAADVRCSLGGLARFGLGEGLVLGHRWHDRTASVAVRIGPVGSALGAALLEVEPPELTPLATEVLALCERFLQGAVDVWLEVELQPEAVPALGLGTAPPPITARLGATAILGMVQEGTRYRCLLNQFSGTAGARPA